MGRRASPRGTKKRFKDALKHNMKQCGISVDQWETVAGDRTRWRAGIKQGVKLFEAKRLAPWARRERPEKTAYSCSRRVQEAATPVSFAVSVSEIATRE